MHLPEPGEPNAGCQSSGLAARDARPRFHLRPALRLPEHHFHFSAVVCILMIHLQPASRSPTTVPPGASFRLHFHFSSAACIVAPRHIISTFLLSALS